MTKQEMLVKFIEKNVPKFENGKNGLESLRMLRDAIDNHVEAFVEISEIFQRRNLGDVWIDCPDCDSPVLLNYQDCNICGAELIGESDEEEKKPKKEKKEKKPKKAKKVEEVEEVEEEEDEPKKAKKVKEDKKPKKVKEDKKPKKAKKVEEVEEEESEDEESEDYPTEDAINAMNKKELKALIKKESLEVDASEFSGKGSLEDLRDAVNEAIDTLIEEEDEDEDEEEVVEPKKGKKKAKAVEEDEEDDEDEEEEDDDEDEEEDDFDFEFGDEEDDEDED